MSGGAHLSTATSARSRRLGPAGVRGVCFGTAALLATVVLAGCADEPITLDSPLLEPEDTATCEAFLDDLPRRLAGEEKRKVNPAAALGRAWGDPAIVVRCGVGVPSEFDETAHCELADGVGWFVPDDQLEDQDTDVVLTAAGYRPVVSVEVPSDYRPEGAAALTAELAEPVKAHLELVDSCE